MNCSGFSSKIFYFTGKAWLYQVYTYIIHNNKTLKILKKNGNNKKTVEEKRWKNQQINY